LKRLIAGDYDRPLDDIKIMEYWTSGDHGTVTQDEIDNIIERNADCIFHGFAYRAVEVKQSKIDDINNLDLIKQQININGGYKSFTKDISWLIYDIEDHELMFDEGDAVIIHSNITGLDVNKFCSKYNNMLDKSSPMFLFQNQEEVIAKFSDFEIVYAFGKQL